MFSHDQTLPGLDHLIGGKKQQQQANKWQEQGVQTDPEPANNCVTSSSSSSSASASSSANSSTSSSASASVCKARRNLHGPGEAVSSWPLPVATQPANEQVRHQQHQQQKNNNNCILLLNNLPAVVNNSALVRQRASAKDSLAAATLTAGASVPLMAGGRSGAGAGQAEETNTSASTNSQSGASVVPKNTALRAEHRKQNMVSVVRPVVSTAAAECNVGGLAAYNKCGRVKLEDSLIWSQQQQQQQPKECSVLEDFMLLDKQVNLAAAAAADDDDQQLYLACGKTRLLHQDLHGEQQARQQAILFRREEFELNKGLRRQHRLVVAKLEERKRGLQIVRAVWVQRGFKQAMETMVDIYHQGLIFSQSSPGGQFREQPETGATLNSLNTSLVVDVLNVIVLRPKLWNLETCQVLLPIINNDLLLQHKQGYESHQEVGLRAIKLILTHFSHLIVSTLNDQTATSTSTRTADKIGVDLSREDRLNKCSTTCRLLLESRAQLQLVGRQQPHRKLASLQRELDQLFAAFESSLRPEARADRKQ